MADRIWLIVRDVGICVAALYGVWKVGPPVVENYYLPTIEFVAGTFHAVAPQPAPGTTFVHMQTPMAPPHASMVLKTDFVRQAGYGTMPMPEAATITDINNGQMTFTVYHNASESSSHDSSQHDSPLYKFLPIFEWCSRTIYQANNAILRSLRQLLDNFYFHVMTCTGAIVSWRLLRQRNKLDIKKIKALHEHDLIGVQEEISALTTINGLEISLLTAEIKSQKDQLDTQRSLLDKVRDEARVANEAKTLAEEKVKKMEKEKNGQEEKIKKIEKEKNDQEEMIEKMEKREIDQEEKIEKMKKEKIDQKEEMKKTEKEKKGLQEKIEKMEKEKKGQLEKIEKMEKEKKGQLEKIEKMEKGKKNQLEKIEKMEKEKKDQLEKREKEKKDQQKKIEEMKKEKEDQEGKLEKIKAAKKKVEEMRDVEAKKAEKAQHQIEKLQKNDADKLEAMNSELAAVQTELGREKAARIYAQQKVKEVEDRVEGLKGDIAHILEQNDMLRASVTDVKKPQAQIEQEGDEEADNAPLGTQRGSGGLQYNRNKLRSNKRADGSIYTSKHPRSTPPEQQGVGQQQPNAEQGVLNGQQHPEAQLDTAPEGPLCQVPTPAPIQQANNEPEAQSLDSKPARRICPYFQQGTCKFGAKCHNAHDLSASSENTSEPTQEPTVHSATSAPVSQSAGQHQSQPSNRKPVKPVCIFFKRGFCRFGAKCHDSHDLSAGRENPRRAPEGKPNPPPGNGNPSHGGNGGMMGVPRGPRGWRGGVPHGFWNVRGGGGRRMA